MDNFAYYRAMIKNTEIDSTPPADSEPAGLGEAAFTHTMDDQTFRKLATFLINHGMDYHTCMTALFTILFAKYTNDTSSLVAVSAGSEPSVLYCDFAETPDFADYYADVAKKLQENKKHRSLRFEELCAEFELASLPFVTGEKDFFDGFSLTDYSYAGAKLCVYCATEKNDLTFHVKYSAADYGEETMRRLFASAQALILQICNGDSDIPRLSLLDGELTAELDRFNETERPWDDTVSIVDLLRRAAKAYPDNIAVVCKDKKYTYREFDALTDRIAGYVKNQGLGAEDVASILLPRNEYMPICAAGVLKAGAAYQPLDPTYPMDRLQFMMEDASAKLLIADRELVSLVPEWKGPTLYTDEIAALPEYTGELPSPRPNDLFILLYTSGSTGVPKGVQLEHRSLVEFCQWYQGYYGMDETSCAASYASFGFDAHMMDFYPALTCGAPLHIITEDIRLDLLRLRAYYEENRITQAFFTTQVGRQYATLFPDAKYPKHLSTGGETMVPFEPPAGYQAYNAYGPTECTILSTLFPIDRLYQNVPIGKALSNLKLYVTDKAGSRVPVGVPGELCISGPHVARGYLNRPEQTADVFRENPFTNQKDYERIYRSGDIVRFLPDGNVEFIGRRDHQVKIRGFRVELTEVEGVIREYEGVKDATVVAFDEAGGGKYIAAYIVSDRQIDIDDLNQFILKTKPPHMVPAVTMQIDEIPLNQNQKVNKKALPKPERKQAEIVPPQNDQQEKIAACLEKVVGHREFGITTDFFAAGLTSIGSIQLLVLLSEEFHVEISSNDLKENSTIEKLERFIASAEAEEVFEAREKYPLTQTQFGIYAECMLNPNAVFYNLPGVFPLPANTDTGRLSQALRAVVDAHGALKCAIRAEADGSVFMYPREDMAYEIPVLHGTEEEFADYFAAFARPFDLPNGPLFRFALYVTGEHCNLVCDFHHIICDGSSIAVFAAELDRVLKGEAPLGERYTQYDLAMWEEHARRTDRYVQAKLHYDSFLKGAAAECLPEGDVFDQEPSCGHFKSYCPSLPSERVEAFCRSSQITPNVFFTAVMGYVLGKYANSESACFTTIYNGRNNPKTLSMMGMLVKTLPVLASIGDDMDVKEYLSQIQDQLLGSMANDIYSFAEVSREYGVKADIMFVYQGADFVEFEIGGAKTVFTEGLSDQAKAAISINIFVENGVYRYEFEYRSDIYSEQFIQEMYGILTEAARSFLYAPTLGDVNLTTAEQEALIDSFNQTDWPVEIMPVNRLVEEQVRRHPDRTAVIACGGTLTYDQLNRQANRLAHALIERGVKVGQIVGLILDRDKYVYITRQGILKAGGAFLPLVPAYPDDRIEYCLSDAKCPYVIVTEETKRARRALWEGKPYQVLTLEELLACENEENPALDIPTDSLCYCLYTSGSTGRPKGVMVEHRNLCNFVNCNPHNIEIRNYVEQGMVSLALAAITFDVSVMEEFIPLCNGMTICMANEEEIHNPLSLAKLLLDNHVDIMKCTPSYMTNIIEIEQVRAALATIRAFDIGAEAFPSTLYGKMREVNRTAQIVNSYGPTECTVSATTKLLSSDKGINIGGPLSNMKLYVVNRKNKILPVGISGELIICGDGVGRGYINPPEKDKHSFFTFKGMKAYHSGDLVRWTRDGEIDFQGRLDNQVKLRGLRVELDEVENAINTYPGVKTSKVIVRGNGSDEYLAGYFTAEGEIDVAALKEHLKSALTYYMVPGALMQLDQMPLTVNGKIDKKQLPEIECTAEQREYTAPADELETELCGKYAEILGLTRVGAEDSFFELGGTSLSAVKIAMFAMAKGWPVAYKDIFENPTPRALGKFIKNEGGGKKDTSDVSGYDYEKINALLAANRMDRLDSVKKGTLGSILLTGATGFLGIHVLREYLRSFAGTAYCLIRRGRHSSCERRLMNMLMYYFDNTFEDAFGSRIVCIEGDITDKDVVLSLENLDFSAVVNCAASVKHFVKDDTLDRINVGGVRNIAALCEKSGRRLVHISTVSVAGEGNSLTVPESKRMKEDELYFGQIVENDYIRTKLLAEREILQAVAEGRLEAKIIRAGNLMSRKSDGEFQINFATNGFMKSLKGYRILKKFPLGNMHSRVEFSPIDSMAQQVLTLAASENDFTVFHGYNPHKLFMSDVIYAMQDHGFPIEIVSDEEFDAALKRAAEQQENSDAVLGLIAYNSDGEERRYEIGSNNRFTAEVLYRLGFRWPIIDNAYLENAIRALDGMGYFDE